MRQQMVGQAVIGAAAGAAGMYLFDPRLGRRRRRLLRDRLRGVRRRTTRAGVRLERRAQSSLYGQLMAATHRHERAKTYNDVTLTHKVETLLFRNPEVPKGRINIDTCGGVVTLRGAIDQPQVIERTVERVRRIQGVQGVENLLHTTDTPPPHHLHRAQALAQQPT